MDSSDETDVRTITRLADFRIAMIVRLLALLPAVSLGSCASGPSDHPPRPIPLEDRLTRLLEGTLGGSADVPGAMLRVQSASIQFAWEGAVGVSDLDTGTPLRAEQTLRIASITKTFVAAAILRLVEEGRVDLDAPISRYVLPPSRAMLAMDGYAVDRITVRMLLQHTSGLWDYADAEAYLEQVLEDLGRRWTRADQLEFAVA